MVAASASSPTSAAFGRRLAAFGIDALIVLLVGLLLLTALTWLVGPSAVVRLEDPAAASVDVAASRATLNATLVAAVSALYFSASWRRSGSTLGQRLLGLRVEPASAGGNGSDRLSVGRAVGRWALLGGPLGVASAIVLDAPLAFLLISVAGAAWIGALVVSTLLRGRGLHDRLSGSVVVRSRRG